MGVVIKKDQSKQAFHASNIRKSIQRAAKEAKYSASETKKLIKEVADAVIDQYKSKRVRASQIRKSILGRLDRRAKSISSAWRRYEKRKRG